MKTFQFTRAITSWIIGCTVVAACQSTAMASTLVSYLVIPASPTNGFMTTLPGYGSVMVTETPNTLPFIFQNEPAAENQGAGIYTWGTDTNDLNMYNGTAGNVNYTLTFTFNNGAPNPSDLLVTVIGLAFGTTATVSQPGSPAGEFHLVADDSSTTVYSGSTLSSAGNGDPLNTGWALYQTTGTFTSLSVAIDQISGDGIGVTLGYAAPEPGSMMLGGLGLALICAARFRKRTS